MEICFSVFLGVIVCGSIIILSCMVQTGASIKEQDDKNQMDFLKQWSEEHSK